MEKMGAAENGGQQLRDVFVSHSSKDGKLAGQVVKILEQMGTTCWVAPRDILSGKQYNQAILDAIKDCSVFLLILSDDSNQSPHVEVEVERAFHYQKTIIPLRIKEVMPSRKLEYFISNAQWVDAFASPLHDRLSHVAAVVKALQMHSSMPAIPAEKPTFSGRVRKTLEATQRNMLMVASVAMVLFGVATFLTVKYAPTNGVSLSQMKEELSDVERQTSSDPRKELAKRGHEWHPFDFHGAALSGSIEEVRLFREAGMSRLIDHQPGSTCFGLELLLVNYSGSPDIRKDIWEEVLAATGDKVLNECHDRNSYLNSLTEQHARPETRDLLIKSLEHYKNTYSEYFEFTQYSPLMLAVWAQDADMVKLFLDYGADPDVGAVKVGNYQDRQGTNRDAHSVDISPLSEAKRLGLNKIVELLQEKGAKDVRIGLPN